MSFRFRKYAFLPALAFAVTFKCAAQTEPQQVPEATPPAPAEGSTQQGQVSEEHVTVPSLPGQTNPEGTVGPGGFTPDRPAGTNATPRRTVSTGNAASRFSATMTGAVVQYEPGRSIVLKLQNGTTRTYTLPPNLMVPPDLAVSRTATVTVQGGAGGGLVVTNVRMGVPEKSVPEKKKS